ncbi:MAG: TlyA family rRNA (cytidine-2'-O)-methyltransferase [Phycisphaerae bacterium]|nr:TlyA family rRNA (cytidine-2'-O)-methyltransferase [Phycisphaerae bacterium]
MSSEHGYVGRGALKLAHALDEFGIGVEGAACADFGCNVGGFTDCLLRRGAARVYAVDTGYGMLAWKLRTDPRVVVMERTNALHAPLPVGATGGVEGESEAGVGLVAMDMGWTPQRLAVPAGLRWLGRSGRIVTLIKPHYELERDERGLLRDGVLEESEAERVVRRVVERMPSLGATVLGVTRSPIEGGAGKGNKRGNAEWLAVLQAS